MTKTLQCTKQPEIDTVSTHNRLQVLAEPHNTSTEVLFENSLENNTNLDLSVLLVGNTHTSTKVGKICTRTSKVYQQKFTSGDQSPSSDVSTVGSHVNKTHSLATLNSKNNDSSGYTHEHVLAANQLDFTTSDAGFEPTYANTAIPVCL